jgi:hypothetical protein
MEFDQAKLVTPKELKAIAKGLISVDHPGFGENGIDRNTGEPGENYLQYSYGNKWGATGECDKAADAVEPYLPDYRSGQLEFKHPITKENHYVNVVHTTEGLHVVDFTHKQFNDNAKFPLVEPYEKFVKRVSMKGYTPAVVYDKKYRLGSDGIPKRIDEE